MIVSPDALFLLAVILFSAGPANAHMEMTIPAPFRSKYNPNTQNANIDYSMTSPLSPGGFPCKGYHSVFGTAEGTPTATWQAGSNQSFKIIGGANHNGGSCQASISEDGGANFKVVKSFIGDCPVPNEGTFDFNVPPETKSGEVIFAWSWFNRVGNREMYMNCAAVTITNGGSGLSAYPDIFVANIIDSCHIAEGYDVDFPNPGTPDRVVIGPSQKKKSPEGACAPASPPPSAAPIASGTSGNNPEGLVEGQTRIVETLDSPPPTMPPESPLSTTFTTLFATSTTTIAPPSPTSFTTEWTNTTIATRDPSPPTSFITTATTNHTITATPVPSSKPDWNREPRCECKCVQPGTNSGYIVNIAPFVL